MGAMMVTELAHAASVTPHVVRHYTRIGLLKPFRKEENGYKLCNRNDLINDDARPLRVILQDLIFRFPQNNAQRHAAAVRTNGGPA